MSVPLDRLYNFLNDLCNHYDLVIYGFFPNGSRKLQDIKMLCDTHGSSWIKSMTTPCLIFHDQEPLNYNLYSKKDFKDFVDAQPGYHPSENPKILIANMHLRACLRSPLGAYDQVLLCHSEQNSKELELYEHNGFIGVYYWSHALISHDWFRYASLDPKLITNFENIAHDFLIYNRAWSGTREYRLMFAELLVDHDLLPNCLMTFSEFDNQVCYTQHKFSNKDFAIRRDDLHKLYPPNVHNSDASADYNSKDYANTAIEVVLETLFDDTRHHLTEKTLRPIACGRPFILTATPGSLQYLKRYGFQTFHGLIDETYDTIQNPQQRLNAIAQEMKRISCLEHSEKKALWIKLYAIAKHNQELFFSDLWHNSIVNEFKCNLDLAFKQLTATGKYQKEIERMALTDPILASYRAKTSEFGDPSIEDRQQLKLWIQEKNLPI
jgi:hypothetical protein